MRKHRVAVAITTLVVAFAATQGVNTANSVAEDASQSVHFVVDVSGSMGGQPLVDAKAALTTAFGSIPDATAVGLRSYAGSCGNGGVLRVPIATGNRSELDSAVAALTAGGGTPTADALRAAVEDLPESGDRTIILISDGYPGCDDPCAAAQQLVASEAVEFKVHTVGFNAGGSNAASMQCIADATGGSFFEADDVESLVDVIGSATNSCSDDIHFVGARGSGEPTGLGERMALLFVSMAEKLKDEGFDISENLTYYAVDYAAPDVYRAFVDIDAYLSASEAGAADMARHITEYVEACPGSPVVVAGYSSGALVARMALPQLAPTAADAIVSAQLMADPAREPRLTFIHLGSADPSNSGVMVWGAGASLPMNTIVAPRTMSWCAEADYVCDPSKGLRNVLRAGAFGRAAGLVLFGRLIKDASIHSDAYSDLGYLDQAGGHAASPALRALEDS